MPCRDLLYRCYCNIYACWPSVTVYNTAAVQTCLLVECCCKMDACWTVATQSKCLLTFFSLNIAFLLAVCFSICYTCWYGVSLSACLLVWFSLLAVPAGVMLHYRSCLLVWYLTISHACWCCASL